MRNEHAGHDAHTPEVKGRDGGAKDHGGLDHGLPAPPARAALPEPGVGQLRRDAGATDPTTRDHAAMEHGATGHRAMEHGVAPLWTYYANLALGIWLLTGPAAFGYGSQAMVWSDLVSGALVVVLGTLALRPRCNTLARWALSFVGMWLLIAPLVFWERNPAAYASNTLVGTFVITFAILLSMPSKAHHEAMMQPGPEVPPGWSYNPSTWWQRAPIIALAFVGFFISRYLAAYQLGHIPTVWDPVFPDGTQRVLESDVSRAWPISDAGLGAVAYLIEVLMGFMGGKTRWRTMPWMVTFFGILVIPLGVTSIVLIIMQPLMVGAWCFLCLISALAMLLMVPLAVDEVVAMAQFMLQSRREGQPFWRTFWVGGTLRDVPAHENPREPHPGTPVRQQLAAMAWGVNVPWPLLVSALLGAWLMAAPSVFGLPLQAPASSSDQLVGALVVTIAVIAMGEVIRPVRFVNVLLGAWLLAAPWLLSGATPALTISDLAVGVALIGLSLSRGPVREQYGAWDRRIL